MKKFGFLITSLVLLFSPLPAIAGIGDAYNCKVIDRVVEYPNGMKRFSDECLNHPIMSQDKFVWLEESISVKYVHKDLIIPSKLNLKKVLMHTMVITNSHSVMDF